MSKIFSGWCILAALATLAGCAAAQKKADQGSIQQVAVEEEKNPVSDNPAIDSRCLIQTNGQNDYIVHGNEVFAQREIPWINKEAAAEGRSPASADSSEGACVVSSGDKMPFGAKVYSTDALGNHVIWFKIMPGVPLCPSKPCDCSSSCLSEKTRVQTPKGEVPISNLKLGSQVIAYDHISHKNVVSEVEQFRVLKRPVCEYKLSKGGKAAVTIEATADHPFSTDNDLYRPIGALTLEKGRTIAMEHKSPKGISIVAAKYLGEQVVYDLRIRDQHNFIANGILVHNW